MVKAKKTKKLKMLSINYDGQLVSEGKEKLKGISGWLDLWFIYFIVVGVGILLFTIASPFIINKVDLSSLNIISILAGIIGLGFLIWTIISFFSKKKIFILLVTIFLAVSLLSDAYRHKTIFALIDIVWLVYFYKSKRVKNTFVN